MFKGHPKGLIAAALANMGERFGYYIMNAVLVLWLWLNKCACMLWLLK